VATVTDNLSFTETYQPFERPPENITLFSLIPRGLRRFWIATDLQAKPVNDDYDLFITATLPLNFAYVLRSFNMQVNSNRAIDFDQDVILRLLNHIPGQPVGSSEQVGVLFEYFQNATDGTSRIVRPFGSALSQFAGPFWPPTSSQSSFRVSVSDQADTVSTAGFVIAHCEFLEYDLVQAQRFFINTPIPVMAR